MANAVIRSQSAMLWRFHFRRFNFSKMRVSGVIIVNFCPPASLSLSLCLVLANYVTKFLPLPLSQAKNGDK
jgi:hypothetical protein